jgi:hypothetical protein
VSVAPLIGETPTLPLLRTTLTGLTVELATARAILTPDSMM